MKTLLVLLFTLALMTQSFSQDNVRQKSETNLSKEESNLLDSLLLDKSASFSFRTMKTAFISGHSGTDIETKADFFKKYITDYLNRNSEPIITYRLLDSTQKEASGGYDVIVMQVPKILTDKQLEINIQKLGELEGEE